MIGTRLGPYEITAKLGEGGMGEVYRATDTRLKRDVAIKILPAAFTEDRERLARFEREAKFLAQLHHPNIASIFGLEEAEGTKALVMELVEGPTLADRLTQGGLPVNECLSIARQIAEALEEAHEKGIIHRDLKPQNIKASVDGKVRVLDFGLAKAIESVWSAALAPEELAHSPTATFGGTQEGVILGTAAYMAPEQARGLPVDKRADIWAFGVVLFEMLTGQRLFVGESMIDLLGSVMRQPIDFKRLPPSTPRRLRELVGHCLERNPNERLRDIGDARIVLDEIVSGRFGEGDAPSVAAGSPAARSRRELVVGAAVLLVALAGASAWILQRSLQPAPAPTARLSIRLPAEKPYRVNSRPGCSIAMARDGSKVAYVYGGGDLEGPKLFVRELGELAPRAIAGTEGGARQPFFSPNGDWIGYFDLNSLKKVQLSGGRPVTIVPETGSRTWLRGSWSDDGRIVYDTWNSGLRVVSADGGLVRVLTEPIDEWHLGPEVIPGSETVLFFVQSAASFRIDAIELDGTNRRTILDNASQPHALASGHLLFERDGGLMVAPFDLDEKRVTGPARALAIDPMVDDVRLAAPVPQLAVSQNGTLVYALPRPSARAPSELVWFDREGKSTPLTTVPFLVSSLDLSPDGTRVALVGRDGVLARLAILDLGRNILTPLRDERLDFPTGPVFSADGREVYFTRYGTHGGEVLAQSADGGEPRTLGRLEGTWISAYSTSRNGRWLVGMLFHPQTSGDLWALDLGEDDSARAARPLIAESSFLNSPALSPDGRWLAYSVFEPGGPVVYLQRFPGGESRVRVSPAYGSQSRWSPDGRELFYLDPSNSSLTGVGIETDPKLRLGAPHRLFEAASSAFSGGGDSYALAPDGRRFLMIRGGDDPRTTSELVVVQNWFAELRDLFSASGR